jgi:hypothetical protein
MRGVLWHNNDVGIALVTRSGSHSIFKHVLKHYYPENNQEEINPSCYDDTIWHPVKNLSNVYDLRYDSHIFKNIDNFAIMVRNPLERFVSSCARKNCTPIEGLTNMQEDVHFWSIYSMGIIMESAQYFLFPSQIEDCLSYLKLPTPLQKLNSEEASKKPNLNKSELEIFNTIYANDIQLYNNLLKDK